MKFLIKKKFYVKVRFDEVSNCKKVYVKVADRCMVLFISLDTFLGCVNVNGICCCCYCSTIAVAVDCCCCCSTIDVAVADDHALVCILM